jgi:hypothetical protein
MLRYPKTDADGGRVRGLVLGSKVPIPPPKCSEYTEGHARAGKPCHNYGDQPLSWDGQKWGPARQVPKIPYGLLASAGGGSQAMQIEKIRAYLKANNPSQ